MHSHTCDCGNVWSHNERDIHNEAEAKLAHTCSACGEIMWWKTGCVPPKDRRVELEAEFDNRERIILEILYKLLEESNAHR